MKQTEGHFTGVGGASMYYQYWEPEGPARAVILLAHGAGEHSARYQHLAQFFAGYGFATAALDHPGHGRSQGTPGFIEAFDDYLETLRLFHLQVDGHFGPLPKILLGHSMGGLISAAYLLQHQDEFAACILSGPAIMTEREPGVLQIAVVRLLSVLLPKIGALQLDASGVCRDPEVVERYRNDPLVYTGKLSARLLAEMFGTMGKVRAAAGTIKLPMLLLHGADDILTSPEGSRFLYQSIASEIREMKIYPGLYHEIFNEPEQQKVFEDMLGWLQDNIELTPAAS